MSQIYTQLEKLLGKEKVLVDEPMRRHTTFRIGGNAAYFVTPEDADQLAGVVKLCNSRQIPYFILGNGSNLLVSDKGYHGVVIAMQKHFNDCRVEGHQLIAGAGTLLSKIAKQAWQHHLTGFEFAAGIPGTLGGATVMNAGAYGSEIKDCLSWVEVVTKDGAVLTLSADELKLGYRSSCISACGYIITAAALQLEAGEQPMIKARMDELAMLRKTKQPLEYPSAGSTFKRPVGYFAGKLIDDAGLRGFQIGGAQVSEKHCGFVVNKGDATAADVIALCAEVNRRIKEQFHVELEMEVKILGEL